MLLTLLYHHGVYFAIHLRLPVFEYIIQQLVDHTLYVCVNLCMPVILQVCELV